MRTSALLRTAALAAALLLAGPAAAQTRGSGSGKLSDTHVQTYNRGSTVERATGRGQRVGFDTTKGMLGGTGAARDALGGDRLGQGPDQGISQQRGTPSTAGDATTWSSGEGVRSWSAKDVREARQEQAPDLEWVTAEGTIQGPRDRAAPAREAGEKGK